MWPDSVEEVFFFHSDLLGAHEVGGILVRYILIHAGFDRTDAKLRFLPPRSTFPVNSLGRNLKKGLKVECWLAWSPSSLPTQTTPTVTPTFILSLRSLLQAPQAAVRPKAEHSLGRHSAVVCWGVGYTGSLPQEDLRYTQCMVLHPTCLVYAQRSF